MTEYAVFYNRGEDGMSPGNKVLAAISSTGKVELFGSQEFVELWAPYFSSDSWEEHRKRDEAPLATVLDGKMLPIRMVDESTFKSAVAGLQAQPVKV